MVVVGAVVALGGFVVVVAPVGAAAIENRSAAADVVACATKKIVR